MFDIGGGELLLILLAILILFGPERIPEISRLISKGVQKVRKAQIQLQNEINNIVRQTEEAIPQEKIVTLDDLDLYNETLKKSTTRFAENKSTSSEDSPIDETSNTKGLHLSNKEDDKIEFNSQDNSLKDRNLDT
ncbi:MAG: twin-arginine translocase TatA/TatE family subunit [Ignavibacteria bacterium]|nr:twin-arginine translocase TatA/TatE family subunit [Ignavibacteria bacterium]